MRLYGLFNQLDLTTSKDNPTAFSICNKYHTDYQYDSDILGKAIKINTDTI